MLYNFIRLKDCVVTNKNVIVRVDFNVPLERDIKNGTMIKIKDDARIKAAIPTLKYLAENGAKVIVLSHFDRPQGQVVPSMSLRQILYRVQELLGDIKVDFVNNCIGDQVKKKVESTNYGQVLLLENLRFHKGEIEKNNTEFAEKLASLGNLYVNDAFSCSHRHHASIVGIPKILKGCAGFLLEREIDNLQKFIIIPKEQLMVIIGGSKISTKIDLLKSLTTKAGAIFIAGGMANTFLYALGRNIGKSLYEKDFKTTALAIMKIAKNNNCQIIQLSDVAVCKEIKLGISYQNIDVTQVKDEDIIADIGMDTIDKLVCEIAKYKTVVWNGPLGVYECKPFDKGTNYLAKKIAELTSNKGLISVAGGGDVVSALNSSGYIKYFSYISTAGGAFLQFLEGKGLPGVDAISTNIGSLMNSKII